MPVIGTVITSMKMIAPIIVSMEFIIFFLKLRGKQCVLKLQGPKEAQKTFDRKPLMWEIKDETSQRWRVGCWRTFLKVLRTLDKLQEETYSENKEKRANTHDVLFREMSEHGDRWDVRNKACR